MSVVVGCMYLALECGRRIVGVLVRDLHMKEWHVVVGL